MSNNFYTHGSFPSTGAAATSASMRAELDLITAGFDKLPTLTANANKFVVVNSGGTALTVTSTLPTATVSDTTFTVQNTTDNTKTFQFLASGITAGTLRIYTMPDASTTLVGIGVTQTLTNKTLTAPVIATIVNTGTLTLPTSTDTLVGRATTDTLTNKTLTAPVIASIVNTGTLTLPTSTDTLVGRATTDTLTNKTLTAPVIATIVNTGTLTLPTSTDTLVGRATTDTLTNKTLTSPAISGGTIDNASVGATTASTGAFTTLSASSTVSGTGFSTYLASPPAIGGTAAAAGAFTTLSASSTVSGTGFSTYLASPPAIGGTAAAAGSFTALSYTTTLTGGTGVITIGTTQFTKDANGKVGVGTASPTSLLQTAGSSSVSAFKTPNIAEVDTISATAATGTINYDVTTQSVLYYTTNASGNFTVNFRGSSGTTLNTVMATGESISATFLVTNGTTAYYNSAVTIDGTSVTPKWQGGSAPTSGNASSTDCYTYVIQKTGSATYVVLASVTKFA